VAAALRIPVGAAVHQLVRLRSADGTPLALERSWLPAEHLVDLLDHPLAGPIYDLLADHFGLAPHTAVEYLESVSADAADAAALGVPCGTALMSVERIAQSVAGLPVEFAPTSTAPTGCG
jgi:GntR family transcriptional regulator